MIPRSLVLLVFWIALWGEFSVVNVASGVVTVGLATWLFAERTGPTYLLRPWAAVQLLLFVAWSLITSSVRVAMAVLAPNHERTVASVQKVRLERGSVFIGSIVANAITLTPGTMTLELDSTSLELSVHVLGEVSHEKFTADVLDLERRVAAAFREKARQ